MNLYIPSRLEDWPSSKLSLNNVIPLYYSYFTSVGCIGEDCSDILLRLSTSSMHDFSASGLV